MNANPSRLKRWLHSAVSLPPAKIPDFGGTGRRTDHFHFHRPYKADRFYNPLRSLVMMSETKTVHIEDETDRWRFVCPRGHRSWEPTNFHFWCQRCAQRDDVDGVFHELRDGKTGDLLERENIRLQTPLGPYEHRGGPA